MTEPTRLVDGEGTAFELELLASVLNEPVPDQLQSRMALGLGLAPLLPPDGGLTLLLDSTANVQVATGLGWFKLTAVSLGLCAVGAAGFGVWHASDSAPSAPVTEVGAPARVANPPARVSPAAPHASGAAGFESQRSEPKAAVAGTDALAGAVEGEAPTPVVEKVNTVAAGRGVGRGPSAARAPTTRGSSDAVVSASESGNYVEQELRLLEPARAAIKRGDSKTASRLLDEYDQRFARGALRREANVLRGLLQR